jgi:hypothetical protein
MDAMDILGALLGKKSGAGGPGGQILKDMLGGGQTRSPKHRPPSGPPAETARAGGRRPSAGQHRSAGRPRSIGEAAHSLEELLGVSNDHHQQHRRAPNDARSERPASAPQPKPTPSWTPSQKQTLDDQAKVLVRAMVSAAKSDGQITPEEQEAIVKRLDHVGDAEIQFLRQEFSKPIDVRELSWSIPQGMEEQAYEISLIAIDLDEKKEAEYLADLAHGLRISPSRCNAIHRRLGSPVIFRS